MNISYAMATPVAPTGWPFALRPPSGFIGTSPLRAVLPSSAALPPCPFGKNPRSSVATISAMVKQSCTSATWMSLGSRSSHLVGVLRCLDGCAEGGEVGAAVQRDGVARLPYARDLDWCVRVSARQRRRQTKITAAAPSEIGQQSKSLRGDAIVGLRSDLRNSISFLKVLPLPLSELLGYRHYL